MKGLRTLLLSAAALFSVAANADLCTTVIREYQGSYTYDYDTFVRSSYSVNAACDQAMYDCQMKLSDYQSQGYYSYAACNIRDTSSSTTPNYPSYPPAPSYPNYPSYPPAPSYPNYPNYPTYPSYPNYPNPPRDPHYPSYPNPPRDPHYPSYPNDPTPPRRPGDNHGQNPGFPGNPGREPGRPGPGPGPAPRPPRR